MPPAVSQSPFARRQLRLRRQDLVARRGRSPCGGSGIPCYRRPHGGQLARAPTRRAPQVSTARSRAEARMEAAMTADEDPEGTGRSAAVDAVTIRQGGVRELTANTVKIRQGGTCGHAQNRSRSLRAVSSSRRRRRSTSPPGPSSELRPGGEAGCSDGARRRRPREGRGGSIARGGDGRAGGYRAGQRGRRASGRTGDRRQHPGSDGPAIGPRLRGRRGLVIWLLSRIGPRG